MRDMSNFLKGSFFALLVLVMIYSPFETEAEDIRVEVTEGVVTSAAVVEHATPIFDSMAFIAEKPTPVEIISPTLVPVPIVEKKKEASRSAVAKPTKTTIPTPSTVIIAANITISTPTPVIDQPTVQIGIPFDEFFIKYASTFNVSKDVLVKIARCESGFRENAVSGPYLGMFQYLDSTWQSTRTAMGENPDPALRANAEEAIKTTAWKIAHGGVGAWPVCGR